MSNLAKRVAVAVIGIPIVLGLLALGAWYVAVPMAVFAVLGARELYALAEHSGATPAETPGAVAAGALVLLAAWRPGFVDFAPWGLGVLGLLTVIAIGTAVFRRGPDARPLPVAAITVFGSIYAGLSLAMVPLLHALPTRRGWATPEGEALAGMMVVALPLVATWVADAAAFFVGTAWGKKKMAPTISPNKSWVGLWAGISGAGLAGGIWFVVVSRWLPGLPIGLAAAVCVGVLIGAAGAAGDLGESVFKREAGVKDSGTLFPGHGGVLDRLDALVFTLPLAYVALALWGAGS